MIVLDTDTISYFLKGIPSVVERFKNTATDVMYTTIINRSELLYGAYYSGENKQRLDKINGFLQCIPILPFNTQSSTIFAENKASLRRAGLTVADFDLLIASIVLAHDALLITNNHKDFSKIKGIRLENWKSS